MEVASVNSSFRTVHKYSSKKNYCVPNVYRELLVVACMHDTDGGVHTTLDMRRDMSLPKAV